MSRRILRYRNPLTGIDFTPFQMHPRETLHQSAFAMCRWITEHLAPVSRLIDHNAGFTHWGVELEYLRPMRIFDTESLDVSVGVRVRKHGTQLQGDIEFSGGGAPAARVTLCMIPLWVARDDEMGAYPSRVAPSLLARFDPDEVDSSGAYDSPVPELVKRTEAQARPLAKAEHAFTVYRHHCEHADQWYFADAVYFAGACREQMAIMGGDKLPELREALGYELRSFRAQFTRPCFLHDRGITKTRAMRMGDRMMYIHRLVPADGPGVHCTIVEEYAPPREHVPLDKSRSVAQARPLSLSGSVDGVASEMLERFGALFREQVNPGVLERRRTRTWLPRDVNRAAAKLGLQRYGVERARGGEGHDALAWGVAHEELAYLCEDFPWLWCVSGAVDHAEHIFESARPELVERYCKGLLDGDLIAASAFWEEGSEYIQVQGTARQVGDRWVLTGKKGIVLWGEFADFFIVYLVEESSRDTMAFIVERGDPGVGIAPLELTGWETSGCAELTLSGVEVGPDRVLYESDGLARAAVFFQKRRAFIAAALLGRMRALVEQTVDVVSATQRGGKALVEQPNVLIEIGEMVAGIETTRAITHRALREMTAEGYDPLHGVRLASVAKAHASAMAWKLGQTAMRLAGARGYMKKHPFEGFLRDSMAMIAGQTPNDLLYLHLAERAVAELRFRTGL